jgi:hypothetical protein
LKRLGIPFVFATGFGDLSAVPQGYGAPVVHKPYNASALRSALASALSGN